VAHHRASEPPKLIHAIHGDLDWIVMKTLEKDRSRRYDTANGLASDIQRHLDNEPVSRTSAERGLPFSEAGPPQQTHLCAVGAVAAALVLGVIASTWQVLRATRAENVQRELRVDAQEKQRLAQQAEASEAQKCACRPKAD
jgi:hypothetical protein